MSAIYQDKQAAYFGAQRKEMLPFIDQAATRILDIGCADGTFSAALKARQGCHVTGVELMPEPANLAAERLDAVYTGDAFSPEIYPQLAAARYDCIILNDVLEHLVDPWAALIRLRELLMPGGTLVASIPNLRYFRVLKSLVQDGEFFYTDKGVLDRTHLRFFTAKTIPQLFESAGLEIVRMEGINGPKRLPPKYAILNWLGGGKHADIRWLQFAVVARNPG
ncbi:class I SAM-dependent methyltransferase [Dechloromonas sp. ZS-1]|uniref:class I SAM-dependent methyltransferase n=1 Tax=Dechloromonas sp. ZS-1 TaxID=3138067 RepID=UPI0031FDD755